MSQASSGCMPAILATEARSRPAVFEPRDRIMTCTAVSDGSGNRGAMQANTDRTAALDFGKLVDHYDGGRLVHAGVRAAHGSSLGTPATARRLEIGAGTGQLASALLAAGGELVAVEPSAPMAERLRHNRAADVASGQLRICVQPFETLPPASSRSLSCGAVTPGTGSIRTSVTGWPLPCCTLAVTSLSPGDSPVLTDPDLQDRLDQLYQLQPDLVVDQDMYLQKIEPLLTEGRRQVNDSGYIGSGPTAGPSRHTSNCRPPRTWTCSCPTPRSPRCQPVSAPRSAPALGTSSATAATRRRSG